MQVIGHRGAAALAPENTLESFDAALASGVDAIETDVRATSDGELILMHDKLLDRTTNGSGLVRDTPWQAIENLDAGSWFDTKFRGVKVPRLIEALQRYGARTELILEIKSAKCAKPALRMVCKQSLIERVTFTLFDLAPLRKIKAKEPAAKVGFLASTTDAASVAAALAAGVDQFCPAASALTTALVCQWQALGFEVRAWGVKDAGLMHAAIAAGVDGMTVDAPGPLLQALGRLRRK